jgi:type IV secretion system protein VirB9
MKHAILIATALAIATAAGAQTAPAGSSPSPDRLTSLPTPSPTPIVTPVVAASPIVRARRRPPSPAELRVRTANRDATREPASHGFINAVQIYPYNDGVLYRLFAAPEHVSDIALQPGEAIVSVAAGDTVRWTVGDTTSGAGESKRVHILVKPFSVGLTTNLIITTDRRTYHLQMESTAGTAMAALSWTYPADELIAIRKSQADAQAAAPVASGLAIERLNFGYAITGDRPAWRPLRAFDDGRQTFIEFSASIAVGEAPPLFVLGDRGDAQLVNYRVSGRFYIVDRLFDAAELRLGGKKQSIVRIVRGDSRRERRAS